MKTKLFKFLGQSILNFKNYVGIKYLYIFEDIETGSQSNKEFVR